MSGISPEKSKTITPAKRSIKKWLSGMLKTETIRNQLLLVLVLAGVLPVVAIGVLSVTVGWQSGRKRVIERLEVIATLKENEISTLVNGLEADLHAVLDEDEAALYIQAFFQSYADRNTRSNAYLEFRDNLKRFLTQYVEKTEHFEELFLLDLEGQVIFSTSGALFGQEYGEQDFFKQGLKSASIHPPLYLPSIEQRAVIAVYPIADGQQKTIGVLGSRTNVSAFNDMMLDRTGLGKTGESYLVGSDYVSQTPLRFSDDGTTIHNAGTEEAIQDRVHGSGSYVNYRGVPAIGVYRWLPKLQMALAIEQGRSEAFRTIYVTLVASIAIVLVSVSIATTASLSMTRSIAAPLDKLARAAVQIAAGDLEYVKVERHDEIGALAQAFNGMAAQLQQTLGDMEAHTQQLEQEIIERKQAQTEREQTQAENLRLQQEVIEAQQRAILEMSTPVIPVMDRILVMPLVGSIDTTRAKDIMRVLLEGIRKHRAKMVLLDVTGVPIMDSEVVNHLNKTIQAARLKGTQTIVTGLSDAVAEAIVDLGIDWSGVTTLSDLQTGLIVALKSMGAKLSKAV